MAGNKHDGRMSYGIVSIATALLVVSASVGAALAKDAGGEIADVKPTFGASTGSGGQLLNDGGSAFTLSGSMTDLNGEADLKGAELAVTVTRPDGGVTTFTHRVHGLPAKDADDEARDEPANFDGHGWKVWPGAVGDGTVHFRFRHDIADGAPAGLWTFAPSLTLGGSGGDDGDGLRVVGDAQSVFVRALTRIATGDAPVDADGNVLHGENWGMWKALPGERNVASSNWIRVVNTGHNPTPAVVVDFSGDRFVGADGDDSIPLDGNVQFAHCLVDADQSPADCTFTFGATSDAGTFTAGFDGVGRVMYVQYRILEVPGVIKAQTYGAQFTVSALEGVQ